VWFACAGVLRSRTSFMLLRSVYAHWSAHALPISCSINASGSNQRSVAGEAGNVRSGDP
jgi:hypothetical protein